MKNAWKVILIVVVGVIAFVAMGVLGVNSVKNTAIGYEEAVLTAWSDIQVEYKKRVDLVYNLADCVKEYDKHEAKVIESIVDGREGAITENASTTIQAVAEAYPDLKSSEQYKTLMLELTTLENEIAQHRKAYNKSIERYNRYTRKFLSEIFLNWTGYEKTEFKRLEYDAPVDAPQDLFGGNK